MIRSPFPPLSRWLAAALLLAAAPAALPQELVVTRRAAELREAPGERSPSLAALPAQAMLERLGERQGPWVRVRSSAGATGWLHLFDIGPAPGGAAQGADSSGSGLLRGVTGVFSRTPQALSTPTSTLGIRGLGEEDLARAQPNLPAVTAMEALRQSEAQAREFASQAAWAPASVEPLPVPARSSAPAGGDPAAPGATP